jgi:putative phage-type endonuclease
VKANEAQTTEQWMEDRAGKFTASRADDLMARTKTGPSASRANLLTLLAIERITGACAPTYQNGAMARGIELEGEARDAYSFERSVAVDEAGFIPHPEIPNCGCSPDGLIDDDGMIEIKCPQSMQKHYEAITDGAHAREYRWQVQHQLMVTGRAWVDVVSYDPRFPEGLQLAVTRVERDEEAIAELVEAIKKAEPEVEERVAFLESRKAA